MYPNCHYINVNENSYKAIDNLGREINYDISSCDYQFAENVNYEWLMKKIKSISVYEMLEDLNIDPQIIENLNIEK